MPTLIGTLGTAIETAQERRATFSAAGKAAGTYRSPDNWDQVPGSQLVVVSDAGGGVMVAGWAPSAPTELLTDGGLENWASATDLTSWQESVAGSSTINREDTIKTAGNYAARLDIDASNSGAYVSQQIANASGDWIAISGRVRASAPGKTARFDIVGGPILGQPLDPGTSFVLYTTVLRAHVANVFVQFTRNVAASASLYYDEMSAKLLTLSTLASLADLGTPNHACTVRIHAIPDGMQAGATVLASADMSTNVKAYIGRVGAVYTAYLTKRIAGTVTPIWSQVLTNFGPGSELKVGAQQVGSGSDVSIAYRPNLIANPGFETAGAGGDDVFGSWLESKGDGTVADGTGAGEFHGGAHAAKLTRGTTLCYVQSPAFTVIPGRSYVLTFWTRGDSTNAGRYQVYDSTNATGITGQVTTGVAGATYTQVSVPFTAPATCVSGTIYLLGSTTNGGIAYFDDVSVQCTTPDLLWVERFTDATLQTQTRTGPVVTDSTVQLLDWECSRTGLRSVVVSDAAAASPSTGYGDEKVTNGEFTSDTGSWTPANATLSKVDSAVDPGSASGGADNGCLKMVDAGAGSGATGAALVTTAGQWLLISARAYSPSANTAANTKAISLESYGAFAGPATEDAWTDIKFTNRAVDTSTNLLLNSNGGSDNDITYYDKVSAKAITPSTLYFGGGTITSQNFIARCKVPASPSYAVGFAALNSDQTAGVVCYLDGAGNACLHQLAVEPNKISAAVTWGATKYIWLVKTGTTYTLYYGTDVAPTLVAAAITIATAITYTQLRFFGVDPSVQASELEGWALS